MQSDFKKQAPLIYSPPKYAPKKPLPGLLSRVLSLLLALHPLLFLISLNTKVVAAPLSTTAIYVIEGASTTTAKNIRTVDPITGALSATIFTTAVAGSAAMAIEPVSGTLYYVDRTTTPNQLRRYDGTTESSPAIATFTSTTNSISILRMGFRGSTGYAIDSNNNIFSFSTSPPATIASSGAVSFQGTSPSGSTGSGDMAFDSNGRGWAIFGNSLYRMDFSSSPVKAYPIGQISVSGTPLSTGTYTVASAAFDSAGDLLVAAIQGTNTNIYRVNLDDATAVQVGAALSGNVITDFASGNQPSINPNLVVTKTVSPTSNVNPGGTLTYTIEVENTGNAPAVTLTLTDALPTGTTYVANSVTLNGTNLALASYPYGSATAINGRNASAGSIKVGNANRATITYQVTVNTASPPGVVTNTAVINYLDGPAGGVSGQVTTNVNSLVNGYKSAKLTTDADGNGLVSPGDTLTWTLSYKNTTGTSASSFQINDQLPTGVALAIAGTQTVTFSGAGTTALPNVLYTGATSGALSNLLAGGATLGGNGVVTVSIPTIVNSGFSGTLSNQSSASGSTIPAGAAISDNVDSTTSGLPSGVTVPSGSITQTQATGLDPTTVSVTPLITVAGKVWGDVDNSANNTFTNINTGAETGTNAGGALYAILANSSGNVIASMAVNSDGTYSFSNVPGNQSNVTLRLATTAGTVGAAAPTAGVPTGWTNTSPLTTSAFNLGSSNITGQDFGIEQLPTAAATDPASQTNPVGTTLVAIPSTHFTGSDPDGTIATFKFTTFPTNATSVTINGTSYTAGTFPVGGVTVTAVSGALPANMVSVDPTDGAVTVDIPFTVIDNAGKESSAATVHVAFSASPPSITLNKTCPTPATCETASQAPGTDLTYSIAFTNAGGAGAQQMVIVDPIPDNTDFKLSSATSTLGTSGLTVTIEYSNDYLPASPGTATWTYTPASGGGGAASGYDRNVKAMRWRVTAGILSQTPPNNTGAVGFTVIIR